MAFPGEIFKGDNNPNAYSPLQILIVFALFTVPWLTLFVLFASRVETRPRRHRTATLLVLGDIGRSPRMVYHADSLAKAGWEVWAVGYVDTIPDPSLTEAPLIHLERIHNPPKPLLALPWILRAPIRILYQMVSVIYVCVWKIPCNTEIILVQNPPAIPTLLLVQLLSVTTKAKLIIDWHNTGYSILALRLGSKSLLVRIAERFERFFGQSAFCHLFVTNALRDYLVKEWRLEGRTVVLHDRPPSWFRTTPLITRLELMRRLRKSFDPPLPAHINTGNIKNTPFNEVTPSGEVVLRKDRPAILISSTSWTADEDFGPLLTALDTYQTAKSASAAQGIPAGEKGYLPPIFMVITGKGALRKPFQRAVAQREEAGKWPDITVRCIFVPAKDYPLLLGSADLGVSMHQSSSGMDLPMKVVDMFGSGVPVLARGFACIGELVKEGRNGRVWNTAAELAEELIDTLDAFPQSPNLQNLAAYFNPQRPTARRGSTPSRLPSAAGVEEEWSSWESNWDAVVRRGVLERRA